MLDTHSSSRSRRHMSSYRDNGLAERHPEFTNRRHMSRNAYKNGYVRHPEKVRAHARKYAFNYIRHSYSRSRGHMSAIHITTSQAITELDGVSNMSGNQLISVEGLR